MFLDVYFAKAVTRLASVLIRLLIYQTFFFCDSAWLACCSACSCKILFSEGVAEVAQNEQSCWLSFSCRCWALSHGWSSRSDQPCYNAICAKAQQTMKLLRVFLLLFSHKLSRVSRCLRYSTKSMSAAGAYFNFEYVNYWQTIGKRDSRHQHMHDLRLRQLLWQPLWCLWL